MRKNMFMVVEDFVNITKNNNTKDKKNIIRKFSDNIKVIFHKCKSTMGLKATAQCESHWAICA